VNKKLGFLLKWGFKQKFGCGFYSVFCLFLNIRKVSFPNQSFVVIGKETFCSVYFVRLRFVYRRLNRRLIELRSTAVCAQNERLFCSHSNSK
jgi:hypothetical protein